MIAVYTPTCRPGIDVAVASLARQTVDDLVWIIGDELLEHRACLFDCDPHLGGVSPVTTLTFNPRKLTGRTYSLDASHNHALKLAREMDADLLVSMVDYTWIAPDGIERFRAMAERHPRSLLTGIAHTSEDPARDQIIEPDGAYSIFAEPYTSRPERIGWEDIRLDRHRPGAPAEQRIEPIRWEFNWAAIPRAILHDERLQFDERYDDFHSCDNIDFAARAGVLGYDWWIDYENVAIRLPRRTYWPSEQRFGEGETAGKRYFDSHDRGDRLELGSGDRPTERFVHLDCRPDAPGVDIVGDATDLSALGFYGEIRACHLLEHISHRDTVRVLRHWREHLWPVAGVLHLEVPNLTGHINRWLKDRDDAQLVWFVFGEQDHEHNFHRTMFTEGSLRMALLDAGYTHIQVRDIGLVLEAEARSGYR